MKGSMKLNEGELVRKWLERIEDPDDGDRILFEAIATRMVESYELGFEDGIKTVH